MRTPKSMLALAVALLTAALSFTACEREEAVSQPAGTYQINFTPARTNGELKALHENKEANLIRTLAQFDALIDQRLTPLSKLPAEKVQEFRAGLVEREQVGIVGIQYQLIKKSLSVADYNTVMALFGLDTEKGFWGAAGGTPNGRVNFGEQDYKDYLCNGRGNCQSSAGYICLSGC